MTDETLIDDLVRAGLAADLIGRVHRAIVSAFVRGLSADKVDTRRERDRLRKAEKRHLARVSMQSAKANDVADVRNVSADTADKHCDLSFFSKEDSRKERKKEGSARARGTRLTAGWCLSDADRDFACGHGMTAAAIATAHREFVDYWIAVPGQRGTKLDWSATWRNRVRQISAKTGNSNGKSVLAAADRLIDRLGGPEAARAYVPGSEGPKPLGLDFGPGPPSPKLISSR